MTDETTSMERALRVDSRESLVEFVQALRAELADGESGWQNDRLSVYLEAYQAWMTAAPGYFENRGTQMPDAPSWSLMALALLAAGYYE